MKVKLLSPNSQAREGVSQDTRQKSGFHEAKIHLVNASAYFARPGPRIVDSLESLVEILHPTDTSEALNFSHAPNDVSM